MCRGSITVRDTTIHFEWVKRSIMYVNVHQIFVILFIRDENISPNLEKKESTKLYSKPIFLKKKILRTYNYHKHNYV